MQTAVSCLHYRAVPFVNTGRGSTVDEAATTKALQEGSHRRRPARLPVTLF
jgi:hypothetical protein